MANNTAINETHLPKNIIMIIGDGMGPAFTTAYRYFNDNPSTVKIEETVFDRYLVGSSSTYPAPVSGYITDSAAAATAMATGVKTSNNSIAVDVDKKPLLTVLEWAKQQGKKTGVVVTSEINHSTPAAYLAHNENRRKYKEIADSYIDDGIKADIYLGGGRDYFIREDRNLVNEFKEAGFHYVDKYSDLKNMPENARVLGLFDKKALPWALDDSNKHRLSLMTKAAINQLENSQGYFMLIEASRIDLSGHARDISSAMAEMDDLAKTLEYLEDYVANNPDTLVVLTADHSTGGLSLGRKTGRDINKNIKSLFVWQPQILRAISISPKSFSDKFAQENLNIQQVNAVLNFTLSVDEMNLLVQAKQQGIKLLKDFEKLSTEQQKKRRRPSVSKPILVTIKNIIDVQTNTGWGTISNLGTHTAIDVPVFSFGSNSKIFTGFQDNTDIGKKIFTLLGDKD